MPGPHIIQSFVKPSMHFFVSLSYHIPHTYTAAYPTLLSWSTHGSLLSSLQLVSHLSPLPISLLLLLPPAAASLSAGHSMACLCIISLRIFPFLSFPCPLLSFVIYALSPYTPSKSTAITLFLLSSSLPGQKRTQQKERNLAG